MMKKLYFFFLPLLFALFIGVSTTYAQTYTKWKRVQGDLTLNTDDKVVIVDLTTSSAMKNNPAYEEGSTVSKESPSAMKVTLKEEMDRLTSEFGDTLIWTADRTDGMYVFKFQNAENNTRYLFDSDQNLRVGFVNNDNASKRKFDIEMGLLHRQNEVEENQFKHFHIGLKVVSGIQAMMKGNSWELMADSINAANETERLINKEIAATKLAFFKKVETALPDPTLHFPGHDYEADVKDGSFTSPVAVVDEDANAAITYWSGNEDIATVDAATGVVTLKKRGTVRIYAQVDETESYDNYLTSYVLRIDDTSNNVKGCRTNPFTVAEAIEYAKTDHSAEAADGVCYFVKGIVSSVGGAMAGMEGMEDMMEMFSGMMDGMEGMEGFDMSAMMGMFMGEQEEGTVTYAISDDGINRDSLSVNNGRGVLFGNMMTSITADSLSVGDWVTVFGPLDYSEDTGMMSMFGGNKEKKVKMPRINYMSEHERNLITKDIVQYFGQTRQSSQLFSITDTFGGELVTNTNAQNNSLPKTSLKVSDDSVIGWVVEGNDSLLTPKKSGIVTVTVTAPVLLASGDTIKMKRKFTIDVRDRMVLPAGTMVGNYELVTDASQLKADDKLLLVATIGGKSKVLNRNTGASGSSDNSNPMTSLFGGSSNASAITIGDDGKISEVPDDALIMTLEQAGDKWMLQTGRTIDYVMTYLYISDTDGGGSTSMIPGMGSSGASLKTGTLAAIGDSCQVAFTFLAEKNDSVKMQFNFQDRVKDDKTVTAKNVIRYEKGMMSTSFGGYEPESDKATLPRLYRLVQGDQYPITVSNALWSTIVSSYDVTLPEGLTGYAVKEIDNNKAILQEVTDKGGLKAGLPYLLNATSAGTYTLDRATVEIAEPDVNLLKVSDNDTADGVYVLADKGEGAGFYKWTGGLLGSGRVYLEMAAGAKANEYIPFAFGDPTGINTIGNVQPTVGNDAYDLQGRRVGSATLNKGIYIVNGRKVIVK